MHLCRPGQCNTPATLPSKAVLTPDKGQSLPTNKPSTVQMETCKVPADFDSGEGNDASERLLMKYVIFV